ncbi:AbiH family protein [Chryseobacterium gleum]|uniref:AbiH family protein n=1 Tax=Chryseobacterium gleum TaxID=250 RepID=UPI00289D120A|nr:AbiH family protein [Chryseobacterium gleum]
MNRLIIVGNGFDLAHGLPTSYGSFLNFIWQNFKGLNDNHCINDLFSFNPMFFRIDDNINSYKDFLNFILLNYSKGSYRLFESYYGDRSFSIKFQQFSDEKYFTIFEIKNKLFELITINNLETWVDIENIYYQALLSIIKKDNKFPQLGDIDQLNSEFDQIKKLLDYYLETEVEAKYTFKNTSFDCSSIISLFEYQYLNLKNTSNHKYFLEFPPDYRNELIQFDMLFHGLDSNIRRNYIENLFLDFNYTSNVNNYVRHLSEINKTSFGNSSHIQIHGHIASKTNPINFGFGDEMDDHYKVLENTGDNKYLQNIKSFMYFNNSNYRKLLNWIESKVYQIYIMGHSCGLSDRTLLNTLFEHKNCKSIKIFYHEKADGIDNFTELSQNISRHFNKKSLMREKVVDKSLSIPLPQNVRYDRK